jgi:hypothetical protein
VSCVLDSHTRQQPLIAVCRWHALLPWVVLGHHCCSSLVHVGPHCCSSLAHVVAICCWHVLLPFFVGMHHCCLSLVCVVALGSTVLVLSSMGGRLALCAVIVLCVGSLFVGGGSSSSVGGELSSVDVGRCCPWG